jgi:hypothetical protein
MGYYFMWMSKSTSVLSRKVVSAIVWPLDLRVGGSGPSFSGDVDRQFVMASIASAISIQNKSQIFLIYSLMIQISY